LSEAPCRDGAGVDRVADAAGKLRGNDGAGGAAGDDPALAGEDRIGGFHRAACRAGVAPRDRAPKATAHRMKLPGDDRAARPLADLAEQRDGAGSVEADQGARAIRHV
jgi:hypothetical protein